MEIEIIRQSKDLKSVTFYADSDKENPMTVYIDWFTEDEAESLKIFDPVKTEHVVRGWESESGTGYQSYSSLSKEDVETLIEWMLQNPQHPHCGDFEDLEEMVCFCRNLFAITMQKQILREEVELLFEDPKEGVKNLIETIKNIAA